MTLRLLVVDDHQMLREGLRRGLEAEGFEIVGEAANGDDALRLALALHPDVVLMDISMPGSDGIDAARAIMNADSRQHVVMLTMHMDSDVIDSAIRAGAVGYLTKDCSISEVAEAVRLAADGDVVLSPSLAARMLDEVRQPLVAHAESLVTPREEQVLQLIADGCSTPEIAEQLFISQKTLKNHLASIYAKLDARDRTQAVLTAVRMGIVKLT